MESAIEQHNSIADAAIRAIEEERYGDALGWLRTDITDPDSPEVIGAEIIALVAEAAQASGLPAKAPLIHKKIIEVMRAVGPVAKAGKYDEGGTKYNFRQADDVFNALHGPLAEAGVYPKPIVRSVRREWGAYKSGAARLQTTLNVTYRFTAEDGSYEDVDLEIDAWNTTEKGIGVAMTVGLRIALLQLFVVATGDPDPDATFDEAGSAPSLSTPLAQYLLHAANQWPLERLEEAWRLLVDHVPGDARVPGTEAPIVWWEVFADRYRREIDACPGKDDLADLWKRLGVFGREFLVGGGVKVADLVSKRGTALVAENKAALQEVRDLIEGARETAEMEHAAEVLRVHLTNHRISAADAMTFSERMAVLRDAIKAREAEAAREAMDEPEVNYDDTRDQSDRLP